MFIYILFDFFFVLFTELYHHTFNSEYLIYLVSHSSVKRSIYVDMFVPSHL